MRPDTQAQVTESRTRSVYLLFRDLWQLKLARPMTYSVHTRPESHDDRRDPGTTLASDCSQACFYTCTQYKVRLEADLAFVGDGGEIGVVSHADGCV